MITEVGLWDTYLVFDTLELIFTAFHVARLSSAMKSSVEANTVQKYSINMYRF